MARKIKRIPKKIRREIRKRLIKLMLEEEKKLMLNSMYITYGEYLLMFLSVFFLYALINGDFNTPMLVITILTNLFSALIYFYNRTQIKSVGITVISSLVLFTLIVTFLYFINYPNFINEVIYSITQAYSPIFQSFNKLKEILSTIF